MCFDAAKKAGWIEKQRLDHIGFGVVQGEDGKRFKTRSSETVRLIDLLDAAKDRMHESLLSRANEGKCPLVGDELVEASKVIGYGAVKYFDLKQHPSMMPYAELSESEKELDRASVRATVEAIRDLGYEVMKSN